MDSGAGEGVNVHMMKLRTSTRGKNRRVRLRVLSNNGELDFGPIAYFIKLQFTASGHELRAITNLIAYACYPMWYLEYKLSKVRRKVDLPCAAI